MKTNEKLATSEVLQWLKKREWPGNLRELQNMMHRLAVYCAGEVIDLQSLRRLVEAGQILAPSESVRRIQPYKKAKSLLAGRFTETSVRDLLHATGGNISEAARQSGLSRVALQKIISCLKTDATERSGSDSHPKR